MDLETQGRAAIVAAGSRGIGRGTVRALLEAGARVTIRARGRGRTRAELQAKTGGEVLVVDNAGTMDGGRLKGLW